MTSHELAAKLGMQECHVHANELVDLADAKDRHGYKDRLEELEREFGLDYRMLVSSHAVRQVQMQTRYYTHNAWRHVWRENSQQRDSE